ncbi:unnamed protein product [Bursaphelenchus okinawaensis]|uniref:Uncharacterized protein n=1 Tax=Bursaphelenchus okinawaensis TaxID=465554 RepID=A0A811K9T7_9BILA|nr:unnamed protein product [Bursaphelenchus okinawaensis]CAG9096387.1 unnamed protein product [Bursaphelenchus okinawaensis]
MFERKKSGNVVVCRFYNKNYKSSKDRERCEPEGQYIVAKEHFLYLPSRHDIPSRMFRTHDSVEKDNIQLFDIPAGVNEDSDTFAYVKNGECSEVQFATNVWKQLPCDKTKFSIKYGKTNYYSLTYIAARTGCEFNIDRDQLLNTYVRFRTSDYSEETDLSILYICIGVIAGIVLLCVVCVVCCKCISWKKKKAGAPKKKKKSKEKKKKKKKPKKETTEVEETESQTVEKKKKKPKKKKKTKKETTEQEETESQSQTAEKKSKKKKDETNNEETNEKGETEKSKSKSGKSGQSGSNPPQSPKQQSSNPKKRTVHDVIPPYEGLGKAVGKSPSKSKDSKTKNSKDKDGFSMQTF